MTFGREMLRSVEAYVPGEQPRAPGLIKLNTNENPYPPSPRVLAAIRDLPERALRQYPDPMSLELRRACAERYGYPDESFVFAGNGMDEVLALALRTFVDPGALVVSSNPTYTLYETLAQLHGAQYESVPLSEDSGLPVGLAESGARLIFLPRPNAPTGVSAPREAVAELCDAFDGLVVIDEAYVDFGDDHCMDFVERFENVIVMRTFSKSFSLAGLRLGLGVARPAIIAEFLKTKDSYNLNAVTQAAGLAAIQDYAYMEQNVEAVKSTRRRLTGALRERGFNVPDSQANFVLARRAGEPGARSIFTRLRDKAILVRYFDMPGLRDALRITVGTDEETDALLAALSEIIESVNP